MCSRPRSRRRVEWSTGRPPSPRMGEPCPPSSGTGSRMTIRSGAGLVAALLLAGLAGQVPRALAAQEVALPVAVQVPILVKILNFDRNLSDRAGGRLVIGVLFQSRYRTSANVAD